MASDLQSVAGFHGGYLSGVDPRARILAATAFSVLVALQESFAALGAALAAAMAAWIFSDIPLKTVFRRMLPLNAVFFGLFLFLPFTTPGEPATTIGLLNPSREGLLLAAAIAMKGNAIVFMLITLVGSMEPAAIGHALSHLRVPEKLVLLLLMTIRYLHVLHEEYSRLRGAMRVRGFRPKMNGHTYRTFGYLVGMLLVRSLDRSERIMAAMKCRGFTGRYYLLDHFAFTKKDLPFCAASMAVLVIILALNCMS